MKDVIIILILLAIIGGIAFYIYKAKRRGEKCIGCPYAKQCGGNCGGCSQGSAEDTDNK